MNPMIKIMTAVVTNVRSVVKVPTIGAKIEKAAKTRKSKAKGTRNTSPERNL
jgi:hypothetical protein